MANQNSPPTYSESDCRKIFTAWQAVVRSYKVSQKDEEVVLEDISRAFLHALATRPRPRGSTIIGEIKKVKQATSRLLTAMDGLGLPRRVSYQPSFQTFTHGITTWVNPAMVESNNLQWHRPARGGQ
jgi:hypothetical protein